MTSSARESGHYLDLASWNRREHFEKFRAFANPFFSVCVELDATAAWETCAVLGAPSFNVAALFFYLRAANETEAFRRRIRGDRVWVHDTVGTSTTVLREDRTFGFAILFPTATFDEFNRTASAEIARARKVGPLIGPRTDQDDLVYQSTIPWIRFTSFTNALGGKDSVPRVVFGKCSQQGSRWLLPVGVEVHHSLVDGIDVAEFLDRFQQGLSDASALTCAAT